MENQPLVNFLNQLLSNQFVMYVKLHRYHWFVQGRHFYQLHALFEEMYTKFAEDLDTVAERILMIDGKPLATMSKYLKEATLVEASADDKEDEIMDQLHEDYKQLISEIRDVGFKLADEQKDEPTKDLLVTLLGSYEKFIWMLSAYRAYK
jgi:starvation-inducible DNA-binding protein